MASGRTADSADLRSQVMPDGRPAIVLSGTIVPGDEAVFHTLAGTLAGPLGGGQALVITTGPGGSVRPAIIIGSEIRARGWSTLVPDRERCASACSMIWLAGRTRMLGAEARIGFHAMSLIQDGRRVETHDVDMALRRWLTQLGYAQDTTATIVSTEATAVRWLDMAELRANGIATDPYP